MIVRSAFAVSVLSIIAFAACGGESTPEAKSAAAPAESASVTSAAPPATAATTAPAPTAEAPKAEAPAPTPIFAWKDAQTPESVYVDEANDRYLVSNINGKPLEADNNGFITELSPDGKVTKLKFIEGGAKVKLNAPKGLAISNGVLYVADIDTVRTFDAKTGASKANIAIPGATFLNDVVAASDGRIFVSDSGLKQGATDFEPTGTDAVWVIEKGKAKPFAKSKDLKKPNGLLWTDKGLLVVTFGANEVYRLDEKGAKQDVTTTPKGGLDGIAAFGDSLLVSSWEGKSIYRGKLGGTFDVAFEKLSSPADIAVDKKRNRLLVPRFLDNAVEAYDLK